jgi:hypothetical protein
MLSQKKISKNLKSKILLNKLKTFLKLLKYEKQ